MNIERIKSHPFFKTQNLEFAYDGLTKVFNRECICAYVQYLIDNKIPFSICLSDIDNFKYVNDTFGHMVGDKVISKFAQIIDKSIGEQGVVGRYGGDEFMIVVENITDYAGIWNILHNLNMSISMSEVEEVGDLNLTMTTGTSRYPIDGNDYEELFSTADKALYRGKTKGRNCFIIYLAEKHANIRLKSSNDQQLNSLDVHSQLFDFLSKKEDLSKGISNLFRYLSLNLMLDHICIETKEDMFFSTVHKISPIKDFKHLDYSVLTNVTSSLGILYINNRKTMLCSDNDVLRDLLEEQQVVSIMACKIKAYGKEYGSIRADMAGTARIWQSGDIDILFTAARTIGIILHYQNKEIKDL